MTSIEIGNIKKFKFFLSNKKKINDAAATHTHISLCQHQHHHHKQRQQKRNNPFDDSHYVDYNSNCINCFNDDKTVDDIYSFNKSLNNDKKNSLKRENNCNHCRDRHSLCDKNIRNDVIARNINDDDVDNNRKSNDEKSDGKFI